MGKATDDRKGSRSGQRLPGKMRIGNVPEESLRLRARLENSDTPPEAARGRSPSCLSYYSPIKIRYFNGNRRALRVGASHKNPTRRWRYKNKTLVLFLMDSSIIRKPDRKLSKLSIVRRASGFLRRRGMPAARRECAEHMGLERVSFKIRISPSPVGRWRRCLPRRAAPCWAGRRRSSGSREWRLRRAPAPWTCRSPGRR